MPSLGSHVPPGVPGLILDISSQINNLPSLVILPKHTNPGGGCGVDLVCVKREGDNRYSWVLSPRHLELGRIRVKQSLCEAL